MRSPTALVLGLGRFGGGAATVRHLAGRGYRVRVADRADPESLADTLRSLADLHRVEYRLGGEDPSLLDGIDLLVCNPAVPLDHPLALAAAERGIEVTQELNLVLEQYPGRILLVTGTNGKSSSATLLARVLRSAGEDTLLGGNIGHSLLEDASRWHPGQTAVLEISSFQLERVDPSRHRVAGTLFTRITSDHLDRHGSLAAYQAAKARAARLAERFVAFPGDDPVAAAMPVEAQALRYGTAGDPVRIEGPPGDRRLVQGRRGADPGGPILLGSAMAMPGEFQLWNAAGAYTAALALALPGLSRHAAGFALARTEPLPYRLQLCARIGGVRIFDNSVSTHVDSTLSALQSLPGRVHWVGGGKSKDGRFAEPGRQLSDRVSSAHLFGSAAGPLGSAMSGRVPTTVHEDLEQALDEAWRHSESGDVILFSPAFASFDQFPNFAARASRFAEWVGRLRAGTHRAGGRDRGVAHRAGDS